MPLGFRVFGVEALLSGDCSSVVLVSGALVPCIGLIGGIGHIGPIGHIAVLGSSIPGLFSYSRLLTGFQSPVHRLLTTDHHLTFSASEVLKFWCSVVLSSGALISPYALLPTGFRSSLYYIFFVYFVSLWFKTLRTPGISLLFFQPDTHGIGVRAQSFDFCEADDIFGLLLKSRPGILDDTRFFHKVIH